MEKITVLKRTATDPRLSPKERQAAKDALELLAATKGPDQQAAEAAMHELGLASDSNDADIASLAAGLLRFAGASSLASVDDEDLTQFLDERHLSPSQRAELCQQVMLAQIEHHPHTRARYETMLGYLRAYFHARHDSLMQQFKAAMDEGKDTKTIREEIMAFYADWVTSSVLPESAKAVMRKALQAAK